MNVDLQNTVRERLSGSFARAREGDAASAAEVAMITHLFPAIAAERGMNTEYNSHLALAIRSKDPELLVCIGEALFDGKLLARDVVLGARFYFEADRISPFMGAFMIARVDAFVDEKVGRDMLRKAIRAGHIPSAIFRDRWFMKRLEFLKFLYLPIFAVATSRRISKGLRERENVYARFWRYREVFAPKKRKDPIADSLSTDRADPFHEIRELAKIS